MNKLTLLLCLLAVAITLAIPVTGTVPGTVPVLTSASPPAPAAMPWWTQHACPVEDAVDCYWDAGGGNGTGHSFMARQFPDGGPVCVMYVERRYARHHDHCLT